MLVRARDGRRAALDVTFAGAAETRAVGEGTPAHVHYLRGPRREWHREIPAYPRVRYADVYQGIDVAFYSTAGELEFDFEVAPGADPSQARLHYAGHDRLELTREGDLLIQTSAGTLLQRRPLAYQPAESGGRDMVRADYVIARSGEVGIALGAYDSSRPLVIDPILTRLFSTYLGGSGDEAIIEGVSELNIHGLITTVPGTIIVTGETQSATLGNFGGAVTNIGPQGDYDAFIARLDEDGDTLLSLTFLGGSGTELQVAAATDSAGNIYVGGRTSSTDLPITAGAFGWGGDPAGPNAFDGFVAKLSASAASVSYLTYLGGPAADAVSAIAVTADGVLAATGTTASTTFAGTPRSAPASFDAFVATFTATGALTATTFIVGPTLYDHGFAVDFAPGGDIVVAGTVSPSVSAENFPIAPYARGGTRDAFVARYSADLQTRRFLAPFGGDGDEIARVTVDASGRAYVYGATGSTDFAVINQLPGQTVPGANQLRGFLMRLVYSGVQGEQPTVEYLVTLGSEGLTQVFGAVPDAAGDVWTGGLTFGTGGSFPVTPDGLDTTASTGEEGFLVRLKLPPVVNGVPSEAPSVVYGTFIGGAGKDAVINLAPNALGDLIVLGRTSTSTPADLFIGNLLAPSVAQDTYGGGTNDMFVMRIGVDLDGDGLFDGHDEDGDGITNADEVANGTDPTAAELYFAEGSLTGVGAGRFETRFSIFNPNAVLSVNVTLRFQVEGGGEITDVLSLGPLERRSIDTSVSYPALQSYTGFSTVIEGRLAGTTTGPKFNIVAERTMTWQRGGAHDGYASHAETAVRRPATRWYLAEGATFGAFQLYYLLQNPNPAAAQTSIRYFFASGAPCTVAVNVPALSRKTLLINTELPSQCGRGGTDVSAEITSDQPIIVERAMYLDDGAGPRPRFYAGHEAAGILEPQSRWFFAEGATGSFFDTYLLVLNQEAVPLDLRFTFLRQNQPDVSVVRQVPANSRNTYHLDVLSEGGSFVVPNEGGVSSIVEVLTPNRAVIAERAMWWPGPKYATFGPGDPQPLWEEAHVSAGATGTSTLWAIADGEAQGATATQTYALISNTSGAATRVRVTLAFTEGGVVNTLTRDFCVAAKARETLEFPSPSLDKYVGTTPSTCGRTAVDNFASAFTSPSVRKRFSITLESFGVG
ncbi:MAG: hypothetical protein KJ061_00600, partial [Vicinamibacteraceae bacterium]|nr:hypothetical protein [Vicinamibacteraceae bacterium]